MSLPEGKHVFRISYCKKIGSDLMLTHVLAANEKEAEAVMMERHNPARIIEVVRIS